LPEVPQVLGSDRNRKVIQCPIACLITKPLSGIRVRQEL
jgi:hypothetical protein